jgi:uncharacterized membrane protein
MVVEPYRYDQLLHSAFSQILENGKSHAIVAERVRRQLDVILTCARDAGFRSALEREKERLRDRNVGVGVGID